LGLRLFLPELDPPRCGLFLPPPHCQACPGSRRRYPCLKQNQ
jgi:hypothetical protein